MRTNSSTYPLQAEGRISAEKMLGAFGRPTRPQAEFAGLGPSRPG
jgi:hypothetical protein